MADVVGAREDDGHEALRRIQLRRLAAAVGTRHCRDTTVRPETMMLMATPETTWSPRWVMQAKPCSSDSIAPTTTAAARPSQAEPVSAATTAAAKAGRQHLALEPDVDDARSFGDQTGHRAEDERRREPDGRAEEIDDRGEPLHHRPPWLALRFLRPALLPRLGRRLGAGTHGDDFGLDDFQHFRFRCRCGRCRESFRRGGCRRGGARYGFLRRGLPAHPAPRPARPGRRGPSSAGGVPDRAAKASPAAAGSYRRGRRKTG